MLKIIIGLTGAFGAGKTTVGEILTKKHGFFYDSCSNILREELKKQGVEENIDNLIAWGNKLRAQEGPGILGKKILEKIEAAAEEKFIVDSLRHPDEIVELKKATTFILLKVEAPIEIRYQRIQARQRAGDQVSFEKFREQENFQLAGSGPQAQLANCFKLANEIIVNEGSLEELEQKVEKFLKTMSI